MDGYAKMQTIGGELLERTFFIFYFVRRSMWHFDSAQVPHLTDMPGRRELPGSKELQAGTGGAKVYVVQKRPPVTRS